VTTPGEPELAALMAALGNLPTQLAGREGAALRAHVGRLAEILQAQGPDSELRARAAAELDQLVGVLGQLVGAAKPARPSGPAGAVDLAQLADGLRTFADYLRAPTGASQAQVEQMVATLQGAAVPRPVPLDELDISGTVEQLAVESARRHGLHGADARRAAERMKREMATLVRQLELRAQQEASRARTAADMERLFDQVVQTGSALGLALAPERGEVIAAFRSVDLAHMAAGLRVFGAWLSTPAAAPAAHVAALRAQLATALGPPSAGDPARSEVERRADFEREIKLAVDRIFRGTGTGGAGAPR